MLYIESQWPVKVECNLTFVWLMRKNYIDHCKQTGRQAGRQAGTQTDRQTDRHKICFILSQTVNVAIAKNESNLNIMVNKQNYKQTDKPTKQFGQWGRDAGEFMNTDGQTS